MKQLIVFSGDLSFYLLDETLKEGATDIYQRNAVEEISGFEQIKSSANANLVSNSQKSLQKYINWLY